MEKQPPVRGGGSVHRDDKTGIYDWKGEPYLSVTKAMDDAWAKPHLVYWSAYNTAGEVCSIMDALRAGAIAPADAFLKLEDKNTLARKFLRFRDARGAIGTDVHTAAELVASGQEVYLDQFPEESRRHVKTIVDWHATHKLDIVALECSVFSRRYMYAGTFDGIWRMPDGMYLIDYKVSKETRREHELQMAAYRYADFIGLPDGREIKMPRLKGGITVLVHEDGVKLYKWKCDRAAHRQFLRVLHLARFHVEKVKPERIVL